MRTQLLAHRAGRVRPGLDDKILADWNGLAIAALARAGVALEEPGWVDMAAEAYRSVMETMAVRRETRLRLAHSLRSEIRVMPAFALDYAAMARAAVVLAETKGFAAREYLEDADALLSALLAFHRDERSGLLSMAARDASDVIARLSPTQDDAIPNAHAVALDAMVRLAAISGETRWLDEAESLLTALSGAVRSNQIGHAGVLNALDLHMRGASIIVAGRRPSALRTAALQASWLTRTVAELNEADRLPEDHPARAQIELAGEAGAFVCRAGACSLPVRDVESLRREIELATTAASG